MDFPSHIDFFLFDNMGVQNTGHESKDIFSEASLFYFSRFISIEKRDISQRSAPFLPIGHKIYCSKDSLILRMASLISFSEAA